MANGPMVKLMLFSELGSTHTTAKGYRSGVLYTRVNMYALSEEEQEKRRVARSLRSVVTSRSIEILNRKSENVQI